ncbi:MAG TPA: DegT/DnrJ/EryC1/StrS family aminotransferase [Clostridia bacterium]|nr:DegT/DnrJ/EryC1/StrS family aminotransferase [Clostridia bacterium]
MYRIGKEEIQAVTKVIESKEMFKCNGGLQETMHCEREMRDLFGCQNAILMTSGKAALISAMVACGIGPGDEVIVPAYTYIASAMAVLATGAIPVIAEVDETCTIDVGDVEKRISKHTKAIMPVHIQGFPCDMDALMKLAEKYNLKIIEDACQADGGSYKVKRLGTIGHVGALSFNQFKVITSGEGGALLTNDRTIFERAFIYHDSSAIAYFGGQLDEINEPQFCGTEYRTNEITAAILREQLKKLDGILTDLRKNKKIIMDALQNDCRFIPSNDSEGDCGTTMTFAFDSEAQARQFSKSDGVHGTLPIDTGKHVFTRWTPVLEKRGAFHPLMDPFKMDANKNLNHNYSPDMCPNTLDILARTVHVGINPDWTGAELEKVIAACKAAGKTLA